MIDRIAKQRLHVMLLVDCSTSMRGERMRQVNDAIADLRDKLTEMQSENANVDFYLTVITYATEATLAEGKRMTRVDEFRPPELKAGGRSNLHLAYETLGELLTKEKHGGIMPDFGGVAPILLLLSDGHPTKYPMREELLSLRKKPWFNVALKYGIAIELNDQRTKSVLRDFVSGNGDVVECYDSRLLEKIIKIIVLTASKVKSTTAAVHYERKQSAVEEVKREVQQALSDVDDWEW